MVMGTIGVMTITADTLVPEQLWQAIQPLLPPTTTPLGRPAAQDPMQVGGSQQPFPKSLGIDMEFPTAAASEPGRESARSGEGTCGTLGF
jgi:hypothetical protein